MSAVDALPPQVQPDFYLFTKLDATPGKVVARRQLRDVVHYKTASPTPRGGPTFCIPNACALFVKNHLPHGKYRVDGKALSLTNLDPPIFANGTEADHVAPCRSVY